jgi:hypothetical protein
MAYSTAYQTVTAGRVREDEGIGFLGSNLTAVGSAGIGVFAPSPVGGKKVLGANHGDTVGVKDYLQDTGVGKGTDQRDPQIDMYLPNGNNPAQA